MSWRRYRWLVWKEFVQFSRDRFLLGLVFVMPILQLLMFGYVVGADVTHLPTAVVDYDHSQASRAIVNAFASSGYFRIVANPANETQLQDMIDSGVAQIGLVINAGTEAGLSAGRTVPLGIVVDGADSRTSSVGSGYAAQIVAQLNAKRIAALNSSLSPPGLDAQVRVVYNASLKQVNAMIPGLIAEIAMLSVIVIMSQAVVRERARGTLEQLFVSPITRSEYILGKVTPYVIIAGVQVAFVVAAGVWWFHVPFKGEVGTVALGLAIFTFTSIGIGLLISLVSHTQQQAQQMVMFYLIPTMVLSGFIFPIESMPPAIIPITYLIPLRYAIVVLRSSFLKGSGFADLLAPLAAMVVFSVLIFGIAVTRFQKRLQD